MKIFRILTNISIVLCFTLSASCSFGPPPSCGENIGGTANEELFSQYFTAMSLTNNSTGETGISGESGLEFPKGNQLSIKYNATSAVNLRVCIQPMGGNSTLAFDETREIAIGEGKFLLESFEPGNYVIRVIINETLIKNFPFAIK